MSLGWKTIYFYSFNKQIWTQFSNTFHKWGIASRQRWTVDNALAVNGLTRRCRPKGSLETIASPVVAPSEMVRDRLQSCGSVDEAWDREGLAGRGSALLEVWDISGKADSEQQQSSFPLSASSYPTTEERQCQKKKNMFQGYFRRRAAYVTCTPLSWGKDYSKMYQYIM